MKGMDVIKYEAVVIITKEEEEDSVVTIMVVEGYIFVLEGETKEEIMAMTER